MACIVLPTKPNSVTGHIFLINLASDVPPVVDSFGCTPNSFFTASEINSESSPGGVIKLSPVILKSVLN